MLLFLRKLSYIFRFEIILIQLEYLFQSFHLNVSCLLGHEGGVAPFTISLIIKEPLLILPASGANVGFDFIQESL